MANYKKRLTKGAYEVKTNEQGTSTSHKLLNKYNEDFHYTTNKANDEININGRVYKVKDDPEFAIKVRKTFIGAQGGADGLARFLTQQTGRTSDIWENKIFRGAKPTRFEANAKGLNVG